MTLLLVSTGIAASLKRWGKKPKYQSYLYRQSTKLFPILLLIVCFRGFAYESFRIPTGSMIPTLHIGENIVVSRHAYNLKVPGTSFNLLKVGDPARGDVVVFRYPPQPNILYIKRVIGIPGDVVRYENKRFSVNGKPIMDTVANSNADSLISYTEEIGGHRYVVQVNKEKPNKPKTWHIPEGNYFVAGDNRDESRDSRVWGLVPEDNLIGKAKYVWSKFEGFPSLPDLSNNRVIQ